MTLPYPHDSTYFSLTKYFPIGILIENENENHNSYKRQKKIARTLITCVFPTFTDIFLYFPVPHVIGLSQLPYNAFQRGLTYLLEYLR